MMSGLLNTIPMPRQKLGALIPIIIDIIVMADEG